MDIQHHSDIEWKFARSELYMEFIKGGATLPVPFNVIPTPKSFYYLVLKIFKFMRSCCKKSEKKEEHLDLPPVNGRAANGTNGTTAANTLRPLAHNMVRVSSIYCVR